MKKIIVICLVLACALSLFACDFGKKNDNTGGNDTPVVDPYETEKGIVSLVKGYAVKGTNGYDYSLEQFYRDNVVNAHTVSVRLDNTDGTVGSRYETTKEVNEDRTAGLYTEKCATSYYREKKIATYDGTAWVWKDGSLNTFAAVNVAEYSFDFDVMTDMSVTEEGGNTVFRFSVPDNKASAFLGIKGTLKNLSFEIKTDAAHKTLLAFTMRYTQANTETVLSFIPYRGETVIDLPEA